MTRAAGLFAMTCMIALALVITGRPASSARALDGQQIFRFDTFGDEQLWTDVLRMHEAIADGSTRDRARGRPQSRRRRAAADVIDALQAGQLDLNDPAVTIAAARAQRRRRRRRARSIGPASSTSVGITCALCHSTVDDSFAPGIGKRLDGWANRDLNVGAIVALSPALDDAPRPSSEPGGRASTTRGTTRSTARTSDSAEQPVAADRHSAGLWPAGRRLRDLHRRRTDLLLEQLRRRDADGRPRQLQRSAHRLRRSRRTPDLVTPKLPALLALSTEPADAGAAGRQLRSSGRAARRAAVQRSGAVRGVPHAADLHRRAERTRSSVPLLHDPAEVGTEPVYAARSATGHVPDDAVARLWQHPPYFHDGSAPTCWRSSITTTRCFARI